MNRAKFIKDLEEYLFDYEIHRDTVDDILSDHEAIIDEAIENGITEDEILNRLGSLLEVIIFMLFILGTVLNLFKTRTR